MSDGTRLLTFRAACAALGIGRGKLVAAVEAGEIATVTLLGKPYIAQHEIDRITGNTNTPGDAS